MRLVIQQARALHSSSLHNQVSQGYPQSARRATKNDTNTHEHKTRKHGTKSDSHNPSSPHWPWQHHRHLDIPTHKTKLVPALQCPTVVLQSVLLDILQ